MDGLRWLLLFFGILVIAGVYWYSRRERNEPDETESDVERREPTLLQDDVSEIDELPAPEPESDSPEIEDAPAEPAPAPDAPQKIVTLRLTARNGGQFRGDELILSLRGIGMRHGKFGIYHRYDGADEDRTIFSAASLVEPGSFDVANIKEQQIPGISLFMVLPGPIDGVEAFDLMMAAARALAQSLDGELLDESGSTLSIQRERYMREEIIAYQTSNLVA
ncbi:MAG: cell division protein ZipA [Woeseiaceae bacterium]|nr:cell division protein ZipA [Woeseiaceae bacterium]